MHIYLAGSEGAIKTYGLELPLDTDLFMTYYYREKTENTIKILRPRGHYGLITIDSGAHSFFERVGISVTSKITKKKEARNSDLKAEIMAYFEGYLKWVKEWYPLIDYFVELDLQEIIGYDIITEWRERMKQEKVYDKCITAYHQTCDTWDQYKAMVNDSQSRYVASGGYHPGTKMMQYNQFIKYAYENGVKIHGFAFTRFKLLKLFPFYSVDSSSWLLPTRYGKVQVATENGELKAIKNDKASYLKYKLPIAFHNSFRQVELHKIKLTHQAEQYKIAAQFFTKYWKGRGIEWKE